MERSGMFSATCTSLSTVTKRCLKTKATNLHRTPPLHKHFVMHSAAVHRKQHGCQSFGCGLKSRGFGIGAAIRSTNFPSQM